MIHDIMETSLGKPTDTGEFRKNPVKSAWSARPVGESMKSLENGPFKWRVLKARGRGDGRAAPQLHGRRSHRPRHEEYIPEVCGALFPSQFLAGMCWTADYRLPGVSVSGGPEDALHAYQWLVKENVTVRAD